MLKKDHTEYDGIESYVAQCIQKEDIRWLPIKKSLAILNMNHENMVFTLEESVDELLKIIEELKKDN